MSFLRTFWTGLSTLLKIVFYGGGFFVFVWGVFHAITNYVTVQWIFGISIVILAIYMLGRTIEEEQGRNGGN